MNPKLTSDRNILINFQGGGDGGISWRVRTAKAAHRDSVSSSRTPKSANEIRLNQQNENSSIRSI